MKVILELFAGGLGRLTDTPEAGTLVMSQSLKVKHLF